MYKPSSYPCIESERLRAEVERLRALIQEVEYECCEHCRPGVRHFLNGSGLFRGTVIDGKS
jgi:hypothetical protein